MHVNTTVIIEIIEYNHAPAYVFTAISTNIRVNIRANSYTVTGGTEYPLKIKLYDVHGDLFAELEADYITNSEAVAEAE